MGNAVLQQCGTATRSLNVTGYASVMLGWVPVDACQCQCNLRVAPSPTISRPRALGGPQATKIIRETMLATSLWSSGGDCHWRRRNRGVIHWLPVAERLPILSSSLLAHCHCQTPPAWPRKNCIICFLQSASARGTRRRRLHLWPAMSATRGALRWSKRAPPPASLPFTRTKSSALCAT